MPARWEKTVEQLDSLAALYEANGIRVYRPRPYTEEERHYLAEAQPGASLLYPADPVYTVGKHYLEVSVFLWKLMKNRGKLSNTKAVNLSHQT